jgi:hypothetical protein
MKGMKAYAFSDRSEADALKNIRVRMICGNPIDR